MLYLTADTHFWHKNVCEYDNRPFMCVEDMNKQYILNWNNQVGEQDEVISVGDFCFGGGEKANEILRQLNGKKYLIRGNHDSFTEKSTFDTSLVQWVKDYYMMTVNGVKLVLFHYPIVSWAEKKYGSVHCYGHLHGVGLQMPNAFNVGVDLHNGAPVSLETLLERRTI
jgi:calcineurin-like phosphoesterase family protein